jgi:hypothetical protein
MAPKNRRITLQKEIRSIFASGKLMQEHLHQIDTARNIHFYDE